MNARTSTTIFLITQAKTQFFLLVLEILYTYVCGMKKILHMQIKLLFILDKLFIMVMHKEFTPPY